MAKFKNVSALGALEIPVLGNVIVAHGEVVEVPDELAPAFASANFEPVDKAAKSAVAAVQAEADTGQANETNAADGGDATTNPDAGSGGSGDTGKDGAK